MKQSKQESQMLVKLIYSLLDLLKETIPCILDGCHKVESVTL